MINIIKMFMYKNCLQKASPHYKKSHCILSSGWAFLDILTTPHPVTLQPPYPPWAMRLKGTANAYSQALKGPTSEPFFCQDEINNR